MSRQTKTQVYENLKELRRRGDLTSAGDTFFYDARLLRVLEARAMAERILGGESEADAWLHRPNPYMADQLPIDLIGDTLGAAVVRDALERIDQGQLA